MISLSDFFRPSKSAGYFKSIIADVGLLEWALIGLFVAHIISASYIGVQGSHSWRQSDVYSQILGFSSFKGLTPFSDFSGRIAIYDIPLYQASAFLLSKLFGVAPLVGTRILNALIFSFTALSCFSIVRKFSASAPAWFAGIFAISPLFIHFYTTPLPDLLSIALSLFCISGAIAGRGMDIGFLVIWICAVLIKSPIPFVFLVFLIAVYAYAATFRVAKFAQSRIMIVIYSATGLLAAFGAERIRSAFMGKSVSGGFAQDPAWYFGNLDQRLSLGLWKRAIIRHLTNDLNTAKAGLLLYIFAIVLLAILGSIVCSIIYSKLVLAYYIPCLIAVVMPWLVFANVYDIHNYYQLPGQILLTGAASIGLSFVFEKWFLPRHFHSSSIPGGLNWFIITLVAVAVSRLSFHSSLSSSSDWKGAEILFRDSKQPVVVYGSIYKSDPTIGGLISSPIAFASTDDFSSMCSRRSAKSMPQDGLVIKDAAKDFDCLAWIKSQSKSFIDTKLFIAWSK